VTVTHELQKYEGNSESKYRFAVIKTSSVYDCTVEDVEYVYNKFSLCDCTVEDVEYVYNKFSL